MSDTTQDFGLFIDGLRLDRNMSREELVDGIVSLSQYKRYLRGATSIPNTILVQLADRLKFSITGLHNMYEVKQDTQKKKIIAIYSHIQASKFKEAYELAQKLRDEVFISDYNKLFFDYCFIYAQHNLEMVSDVHALGMYSELVNYPNCVKNETFNWVEINILMEIVRVSSLIENYLPSQHMYEIITSPTFKFISAGHINFIPSVFSTLTPVLGQQDKNEEVLRLANEGIAYCRKHQISSSLASLYMSKTIALSSLERVDEAKVSGKKALMQYYIDDNKRNYEYYKKLLRESIELDVDFDK